MNSYIVHLQVEENWRKGGAKEGRRDKGKKEGGILKYISIYWKVE